MDEWREVLQRIQLSIDEQQELAALRRAQERRVFIDFRMLTTGQPHSDEFELHLLAPGTCQCIAVRRSWAQMLKLVEWLTPIALRRLVQKATPCAVHPA